MSSSSETPRPAPAAPVAALVSVGGSPAPILFTLRQERPAHVWYFCSAGSRAVAEEIHGQLDWHPDRDFIEVERFEELGPCYRALRKAIPRLLARWRVPAADVLVDYTGGTKTMSAALVLAGVEFFERFAYVGGHQREKNGLGITVDGRERAFYPGNPWVELAIREVERARDLWAAGLFDAAALTLRAAAPRVPRRVAFETVATIADALAARHRLDFRGATTRLGSVRKLLPALFDGRDDAGLIRWSEELLELCSECAQGTARPVFLRELLDNALRTAAQGRYEDAAARLYRAMEMQGQIWLAEATAGAFLNGRKRPELPLPPALSGVAACLPDDRGEVTLSLEQVFLALHRLGEPRVARIVDDLALDRRSRWRTATEKRNASILAHGTTPIDRDGFDSMKAIAAEFLAFDLEAETRPIPALNPRWLE